MEDPLDSYRQAITDNFSTITIGNIQLSLQEGVYNNLSRNLTFQFDDVNNQKGIRLFVVVTFDFRFAETIERFIKSLGEDIDRVKNNQLKNDCVYVVPIATSADADAIIYNSFKEGFKDEEVFCLS